MKTSNLFTLLIFLFICSNLFSNNIQVDDIFLKDQDPAANTLMVEFDLSWENSWRVDTGPSNWDAAWVFMKYKISGGNWLHCTLSSIGHANASGSTINVSNDNVGAFIYRSGNGTGDVNFNNNKLKWNYGANGVSDDASIEIQVFAVEMVYVPQGAFYLGGLGDEANKFYRYPNVNTPYLVSSESAITVSTTTNRLYYNDDFGSPGDQLGPIPAAFPKGFQAFYCMKYEVTQGQWIAFFNSLTDTQKLENDVTDNTHKGSDNEISGNAISWLDVGSATTTRPERPMTYVGWDDVTAYMDWAGLRPMTGLEFEKACRGPIFPVANEFAWGSDDINETEYIYQNLGSANEIVTNPDFFDGNAIYLDTDNGAPSRVGIFASSISFSSRVASGATYYGIMEMSGNVYERGVTVGSPSGRAFTNNHGNGLINSNGNSTVSTWPDQTGQSFRGAGFINQTIYMRVGDRYDAVGNFFGANSRLGFRCVRTED